MNVIIKPGNLITSACAGNGFYTSSRIEIKDDKLWYCTSAELFCDADIAFIVAVERIAGVLPVTLIIAPTRIGWSYLHRAAWEECKDP